jgi:biopolymer transport protein ExbD
MPLTLGPWPRRIYVPTAWATWSPECRSLALRHELVHLDRRDGLWQTLQMVVRALYFFHPLVWLLDREIDATREMAVDDAAAGAGGDAGIAYSYHLMDIAESLVCGRETCRTAAALFRRRRELMGRIRYQLEKGETMQVWTKKTILVVAALLVVAVPLSWHVGATESGDTHVAAVQGGDPKSADDAKKAEHAKQAKAADKSAEPIELKLVIKGDDNLEFKDHSMKVTDLERKLLKSKLGQRDDVVFTIVCAEGVTMGNMHIVSSVLRATCERPKVRFVNAEGAAVPLNLPKKNIEEKLATLDAEDRADIAVAADGTVTYDGKKLSAKKLGKVAHAKLQENPELVMAVGSDAATPYTDFVAVLDHLKKAGAERIAILPPKGLQRTKTTSREAEKQIATP